jgi:hypothetical protein
MMLSAMAGLLPAVMGCVTRRLAQLGDMQASFDASIGWRRPGKEADAAVGLTSHTSHALACTILLLVSVKMILSPAPCTSPHRAQLEQQYAQRVVMQRQNGPGPIPGMFPPGAPMYFPGGMPGPRGMMYPAMMGRGMGPQGRGRGPMMGQPGPGREWLIATCCLLPVVA